MKKTLLLFIALTIIFPMTFSVVSHAEGNGQNVYATYFSTENWGGPYGTFGVEEKWNGIDVVYDGWYTKALSPEYISVKLQFKKFLKSIAGNTGYAQEAIFDFAFLTKQYTSPDWSRNTKGLYVMTRNIDGKLYVQVTLKGNSGEKDGTLFEEILDKDVYSVQSVTLKWNGGNISLFIDDAELAPDIFAAVPISEITDGNGYTFFAMESYSAGGSGTDADKRTIFLNYVATEEGQTPDPAIIEPEKILAGEEDYDAPAGLGLTAKKYGGNAKQNDESVLVSGNSVLYTPLNDDCILLNGEMTLPEGKKIRINLSPTQKVYDTAENAPLYFEFTFNDGIDCGLNGGEQKTVANGNRAAITLCIELKGDKYSLKVNDIEFDAEISKGDFAGEYGTFLGYTVDSGASLEVLSMRNPVTTVDITDPTMWDSPFGGVVTYGEDTLVYAHSTLKAPLDKDFVSVEFKIHGLLDTSRATAFLCFAIISENKIFDPLQPSVTGIDLRLRVLNGRLQFEMLLHTEFMGTIQLHDWTDLDIGMNERIRLSFKNEKDGYRVIINDYEIAGDKMSEIITSDAADRNDKTYFTISCWHDTSVVNNDVKAERSVAVYTIDNVFDDGDIPSVLKKIGETEKQDSSADEPASVTDTSSSASSSNSRKKKGCGGYTADAVSGMATILIFASAGYISLKKKK